MKIDPKKAILVLIIPCEKCDGAGYDRVCVDDHGKETMRIACAKCGGSGQQHHPMTLDELLSNLRLKIPEPPVSIGSALYRPEEVVWRMD